MYMKFLNQSIEKTSNTSNIYIGHQNEINETFVRFILLFWYSIQIFLFRSFFLDLFYF